MAGQDHYAALGIGRYAKAGEIRKAYRALAMRHHPDRNPGNKEAATSFRAVKEAYDVLSDERRRAAYDLFGHASAGNLRSRTAPGAVFDQVFRDAAVQFGQMSRLATQCGDGAWDAIGNHFETVARMVGGPLGEMATGFMFAGIRTAMWEVPKSIHRATGVSP